MPNFNNWLSYTGDYIASEDHLTPIRAILAWGRINAKPTEVRFRTPAGTIGVQTIRLESNNVASSTESVSGTAPKRGVIVFGIRDHPTLPDTIMDEGYSFIYHGDLYTIRDIILTLGEVQGIAEATR